MTLLDEYAAAAKFNLSPKLLRWLTENSVKGRKLSFTEQDGIYFFDDADLDAFDKHLRAPWPPTGESAHRPSIPKGIKEEVVDEFHGQCAVCRKHENKNEIAHIAAFAVSRSHHPENLIYLCPNDHTKFDDDTFGPADHIKYVVKGQKHYFSHFRRNIWSVHAVGFAALHKLSAAARRAILNQAIDEANGDSLLNLVQSMVHLMDEAANSQIKESDAWHNLRAALNHVSNAVTAGSPARKVAADTAEAIEEVTSQFLNTDLRSCPLCEGSGYFEGWDCPICGGAGTVEKNREIDLSPFDWVECPLCRGEGSYPEDCECPLCSGDKRVHRHEADGVELDRFRIVPCPVCDGDGKLYGELCPCCWGHEVMPKEVADRVDLSAYNLDKCPLCKGSGAHQNMDCPVCLGEGELPAGKGREVDIRDYDDEMCPVCNGIGEYWRGSCPACRGEGELPKWACRNLDIRDFEMVTCPDCRGKGRTRGSTCDRCDGDGELPRNAL